MKTLCCAVGLLAVLVVSTPAMAGRCFGYPEERIVWCDDFDNYCVGGDAWPGYPPFPTKCADGAIKDNAAFYANWPLDDSSSGYYITSWVNSTTQYVWNTPFSAYFHRGEIPYYANRASTNFADAIAARYPGKNAVNGTNDAPLIITIPVHYGALSRAPNSICYTELTLGDDRAPTDYVLADCPTINGEDGGPFPIVCQQWLSSQTVVPCPPLSTEVHASLAFGTLSYTDRNPCDVETGRKPTQYHVCIFDGLKWWDLRSNVFPGNGADFNWDSETGTGFNWYTVTIKTSTFDIEFTNTAGEVSTATIPRQYLGPFDGFAYGTGPGCELDPNTGECLGDRQLFTATEDFQWWSAYPESPVLLDGELVATEGACCKPDGTCEVTDSDTCLNVYGGTFAGMNTTCEEVLCCPTPFADSDTDGDVDQSDFGAWQLCYTNVGGGVLPGCECYNRDEDNDVDGDDFAAFAACWSGANVAWTSSTSCP